MKLAGDVRGHVERRIPAVAVPCSSWRAKDLLARDFPEQRFAVPGLIADADLLAALRSPCVQQWCWASRN